MVGRRALLLGAAGTLLGGCGAAAERDARPDRRSDADVLGELLEQERRSVALYAAARGGGRLVRRLEAHERAHVALLEAALRRMGAPVPAGARRTPGAPGDPLELAQRVEETAVAAYVTALPDIGDDRLRAQLAGVLAAEAAHLAGVRRARGLVPSAAAFVTGHDALGAG